MNQLPWKSMGEEITECLIEDLGLVYCINRKQAESNEELNEEPNYEYDLYFSNDPYNLTNKELLKSDSCMKTLQDMALYHFEKMLSKY